MKMMKEKRVWQRTAPYKSFISYIPWLCQRIKCLSFFFLFSRIVSNMSIELIVRTNKWAYSISYHCTVVNAFLFSLKFREKMRHYKKGVASTSIGFQIAVDNAVPCKQIIPILKLQRLTRHKWIGHNYLCVSYEWCHWNTPVLMYISLRFNWSQSMKRQLKTHTHDSWVTTKTLFLSAFSGSSISKENRPKCDDSKLAFEIY